MTPDNVVVPREWFFGVQAFIANFTSGNEILPEVQFIAKRKGVQWAKEATRLRDMLAAAPAPEVCMCIDCGGTEPGNTTNCEFMLDLHGQVT